MRYLVLSDIHANLEALETVLDAADRDRATTGCWCSATWSATAPIRTRSCERIRALAPLAVIRGNHDKVGAGLEPSERFNAVARTRHPLDLRGAHRRQPRLAGRPAGRSGGDRRPVEICHGTPFDEDAYVFDETRRALRAMQASTRPALPVRPHPRAGRLPAARSQFAHAGDRRPTPPAERRASATAQYLINPGSVGQPRDGDPRAGFADRTTPRAEVVEITASPYPVERTQARIREAGLPEAWPSDWRDRTLRPGGRASSGLGSSAIAAGARSSPPALLRRHRVLAAREPSTQPITIPISSTTGM